MKQKKIGNIFLIFWIKNYLQFGNYVIFRNKLILGWGNSTVRKVFVLHAVNLGWILGIPCGPPSLPGSYCISEHRTRINLWALPGVTLSLKIRFLSEFVIYSYVGRDNLIIFTMMRFSFLLFFSSQWWVFNECYVDISVLQLLCFMLLCKWTDLSLLRKLTL